MQRILLMVAVALSLLTITGSIHSQETGQAGYLRRAKESYDKGQYEKCISDLNEVIRLNPNSAAAFSMRGEVWLAKKCDFDKAIADFNQVLRLDPGDATVYGYRGFAWDMKGEYDKAIADFNQVLRLRPHDIDAYGNRGLSWNHKGEYDKSIDDFTQMIWLVTNAASEHVMRGAAWAAKRDFAQAREELDQALEFQHPLASALGCRGDDWVAKGDYGKAEEDYRQAVDVQPKVAGWCNSLAWLLATCPDQRFRNGKEALALAQKACRLGNEKISAHLDTLAAAYAETGDFGHARQWQKKAIATNSDETLREELQSRLKLYEQNKPYHEEMKKH
jgi:tetratricopeptide (TPR) repeat protein